MMIRNRMFSMIGVIENNRRNVLDEISCDLTEFLKTAYPFAKKYRLSVKIIC